MARRRRVALIVVEYSGLWSPNLERSPSLHPYAPVVVDLSQQRSLTSRTPQWLDDWDGDGIISRTTTRQLAETAARTKIPLIDLTDRHGTFGLPQVWSDDRAIANSAPTI